MYSHGEGSPHDVYITLVFIRDHGNDLYIGMGQVKSHCLYIWHRSRYLRKRSKLYNKDMYGQRKFCWVQRFNRISNSMFVRGDMVELNNRFSSFSFFLSFFLSFFFFLRPVKIDGQTLKIWTGVRLRLREAGPSKRSIVYSRSLSERKDQGDDA